MKRKEKTSSIGFSKKKNLTYIVYRRRISKLAKEKKGGNPNRAMRPSLPAWIAKVVGLLFYLTIHLNMCYTM